MSTWRRRLLLVEDDQLLATLLATVLENEGFDVHHAVDAASALKKVASFDPDFALLDIHLGDGPTGISVGQILRRKYPHVGMVFLTRYPFNYEIGLDKTDLPSESVFLSKTEITTVGALRNALESARSERHATFHGHVPGSPLSQLTTTQISILRLVACGLTNSAIANMRSTKERTVEQRLKAIYSTLKIPGGPTVNQRVEAAKIYVAEAGKPTLEEKN